MKTLGVAAGAAAAAFVLGWACGAAGRDEQVARPSTAAPVLDEPAPRPAKAPPPLAAPTALRPAATSGCDHEHAAAGPPLVAGLQGAGAPRTALEADLLAAKAACAADDGEALDGHVRSLVTRLGDDPTELAAALRRLGSATDP